MANDIFAELADVIHEELVACIGARRLEREGGDRRTAELIADVVLRAFEVRPRG